MRCHKVVSVVLFICRPIAFIEKVTLFCLSIFKEISWSQCLRHTNTLLTSSVPVGS